MSGTSADGIDAALCEIEGSGATLRARVLDFRCFAWENQLRERILRACANEADVRELARLNVAVGEAFADAALALIEEHGAVDLIGSHGQTVCHLPDSAATLQIGESAIIAARTATVVVADFRARDMAEGGQGAPLVPYVDWVLLRDERMTRAVQNIGGIANATILPAACALEEVRAWDTGPGNLLMDECARQLFGLPFDASGALAARGRPDQSWLQTEMRHPFFERTPPKTAGREEFGREFAALFLARGARRGRAPHDVLATVTALTARSIADSLRRFGNLNGGFELIVGGGGARNETLGQMLRAELPQAQVKTHEAVGFDSDAKEALAFAILAHESRQGVATSVPGATGARRSVVLGKMVLG